MPGHEAIRALRKTAPGMGIVAHGERPERHLASAALQAGASAYVARTAGAERAGQGRRGRRSSRSGSSTRRCRRAAAAAS